MSAWTVIDHEEVPSNQSEIEFTNIPQTYDDLVVVWSIRTNRSGDTNADIGLSFNGNSSNYSLRDLIGTGSGVSSRTNPVNTTAISDVLGVAANATASTFSNGMAYIPNYRGSTAKSVSIDTVNENNATGSWQLLIAGLWNNSAAITSLKLADLNSASIVQYSSATLYGITKGSSGGVTVS